MPAIEAEEYVHLPRGTVFANPLYYPIVTPQGIDWHCESANPLSLVARPHDETSYFGIIHRKLFVKPPLIARFFLIREFEPLYFAQALEELIDRQLIAEKYIGDAYNISRSAVNVPPAFQNVYVVNNGNNIYIKEPPKDPSLRSNRLFARLS